jgi:VIT1/CCC1 family predicted Fe2+/Mn2+ transporter
MSGGTLGEESGVAAGGSEDHYENAEQEHRTDTGSGILRASIFGISDGLVSNLALVMGVAGGTQDASAVVLAGSAGLLAGAFSMAAGEYVSMQTQREAMEQQLQLEREHIIAYPEEEEAHLKALLARTGFSEETAVEMAARIHEEVDPAVDFHALLELGIVPSQMGSPISAAFASFISFIVGAAIPLAPWLMLTQALEASMLASGVALLIVGGAATRITHRSMLTGAFRQLLFGGCAAAITYALGRWIGASL